MLWLQRFRLRKHRELRIREAAAPVPLSGGLDRCDIRYINLASRPDRRESIEKQFALLGVSHAVRVEATASKQPLLGCARSHVQALNEPAAEGRVLMICEDDLVVDAARSDIDACIDEFLASPELDVLCLAYNLGTPPYPISGLLSITDNTQTASVYLVKENARKLVRRIFLQSCADLARGRPESVAANDQIWKKLQKGTLFFAIPRARMARQAAGYSDIERRYVDYGL